MRGAFVQVNNLVRQRFPGLEVHGSNFPIPAWKVPIVRALQAVQLAALAVCFAGDTIFRQINMPPPQWYTANVAPNRFGVGMGVWFVGNTVITNLQNTGAFEVYFDGKLIFSKLAEERMPSIAELLAPIEAYARAHGGVFSAPVGAGSGGGAGGDRLAEAERAAARGDGLPHAAADPDLDLGEL
ncbi:hypothetical protein HYH03_014017 [Edaphochlamys debaryana]|uniref:Selenoprotein T n=1 Tax=Edaphochlamys debaryana TaxID=47281 RepID=A0A836BSP0_9CHLO|nr:hypothetical protein HYH03_014017 [Edaphochlamys debaryana]|eukprot:KAG2487450.1 hypothetical protein HYH03_014017 [Edaphochlamys debaryana]